MNFHDRTKVVIQSHVSLINKNQINVPLDYKIYDVKITLLNIIGYTNICFLPFLLLHLYRLGTEFNLSSYLSLTSNIPLFFIIIMLITILHLLLFFSIFWLNIYSRFYKEIKKLYIYLMQFGGCLDQTNFLNCKEPYIFVYFLNPINKITLKNINMFLYKTIQNLQFNKSKNALFIRILIELKLSLPFFYKGLIYVIILIFFIFELYNNNFILRKFFYLLFFFFIYKQIYNIIYFSWYHNLIFDKTLALYYYKLHEIITSQNSLYNKNLRLFYITCANYDQNDRLLYYLNTGLNLNQADAFRNNEKWPKYPHFYDKYLFLVKLLFIRIKQITRKLIAFFLFVQSLKNILIIKNMITFLRNKIIKR